ncbi:hypothetical protein FOFC_10697 [Fusarium oxysporum]|nr:hypothetical protein FOFC_21648 [Fusarium oxysporum]KAI8395034.1 hypothetical protein FOFC_21526 [Fusarium oxysporum]KAI8410838.1 hypothetical protein FOFC_10697 [Fusarium oxysporum]
MTEEHQGTFAKPKPKRQETRKRSPKNHNEKPDVSEAETVTELQLAPKEDKDLLTVLTDEYLGTPKLAEGMTHQSPSHNHIQARPEITFAYYPFLCINNLSSLHIDDINYLESQGCFKLPGSSCLDHPVRAFFNHAHPIFPVVNEAEFWLIYDPLTSSGKTSRVPVILLSAMLFAASTWMVMSFKACSIVPHMRRVTASFGRPSFSTTKRLRHHQSSLLKYLFCLHTWPHKKAQELIDRALNGLVEQFIIVRMVFTRPRFRHQSKVTSARATLGDCGGVASSVTVFTACTPGGSS